MPMSWTPENDRLLLLKLVETHGISVKAEAIVAAWPAGGEKPTVRAIKERFVRLRQLAGVNGKITITTPKKARVVQPKTPTTSVKKRKVQQDTSESDADEHVTEEETPTAKRKSAQRGGAGRGRHFLGNGHVLGDGHGNDDGQGNGAANAMDVCVKTEVPDNSSFKQLSARASKLSATMSDPFDSYSMTASGVPPTNAPNGGYGMHQQPSYHGFDGNDAGMGVMNSYGANGMNFDGYTYTGDMGLSLPVQAMQTSHPQFSGNHQSTMGTQRDVQMTNAYPPRSSAAPSDGSAHQRARSARKASQQATNGWRRQDNEDYLSGEKTSEEDSQGSEFHQSEEEI